MASFRRSGRMSGSGTGRWDAVWGLFSPFLPPPPGGAVLASPSCARGTRQGLNLGPMAFLHGLAQAGCPLCASFPICTCAQEPPAQRVAGRAVCLVHGKHSARVHTLFPFLVGGARLYPAPSPKPQSSLLHPSSPAPKQHCSLTELPGLSSGPRRWRGIAGSAPRHRRPSSHVVGAGVCAGLFPTNWGQQSAASRCLGGYSQRRELTSQGFVGSSLCPVPPTLGPQGAG